MCECMYDALLLHTQPWSERGLTNRELLQILHAKDKSPGVSWPAVHVPRVRSYAGV